MADGRSDPFPLLEIESVWCDIFEVLNHSLISNKRDIDHPQLFCVKVGCHIWKLFSLFLVVISIFFERFESQPAVHKIGDVFLTVA